MRLFAKCIRRRPPKAFSGMALIGCLFAWACDGDEIVDPNGSLALQPVDPLLVASVPIPPNFGIHDTYVRDGLAFVCAWDTGLMIFDVGNGIQGGSPENPVEISRIATSAGPSFGPHVHNAWWFHNPNTGERKYVFVGQEGPLVIGSSSSGDIHVVDVSDLSQPVEVAFYHMAGTPASAGTHNFWMDEQSEILYAAYYNGGVVALDVSGTLAGDLASREIARIAPDPTAYTWGVQLHNGSLYAIDFRNGLYQLQLSGNTFSVLSGGNNVSDRWSSDLWLHGEYAYTGTWGGTPRNGVPGNALKIWRLDSSGAPALIDSIVTPDIGIVSDVQVSDDGTLLMFSAEIGPNAGVHFFSLADPAQPSFIGKALRTEGVHTSTLADIGGRRYAFAAKNRGPQPDPELLIFDVTDLAP